MTLGVTTNLVPEVVTRSVGGYLGYLTWFDAEVISRQPSTQQPPARAE